MKSDRNFFCMGEVVDLTLAILAKALLCIALAILIASFFFSSPQQSRCESIGGRYDGRQCWYNGGKIDVDKYVEDGSGISIR